MQFQIDSSLRLTALGFIRLRGILLACVLLLQASIAWSAGLGGLTLHSSLGQLLDAEIRITAVDADDAETLQAYMASSEVFEQMGILQASVLRDIRFSIEANSQKELVLKVTSVKPVREPFINMVVELSWAAGTYLREYTFLLDPVNTHPGEKLASQPQETLTISPAEATPSLASNSSQSEASEFIVVVNRGDSLLDIARGVKPTGVTNAQVAMAIYERNPKAFSGSVHRLKRGAELIIPTPGDMRSRSASVARRALNGEPEQTRDARKLQSTVPEVATTADVITTETDNLASATVDTSESIVNLESTQAVQGKDAPLSVPVISAATPAAPQNTDVQSVVQAADNLTQLRPAQTSESVSALRTLIMDLRSAMLGLGKELEIKTTQLDEISQRVDQLQHAQAESLTNTQAANGAVVTPALGLKKSTSDISSAVQTGAPDQTLNSDQPKQTEASTNNISQDESTTQSVEPVSMLEPTKLPEKYTVTSVRVERDSATAPPVQSMPTRSVSPDDTQDQSRPVTGDSGGMFAWFLDPRRNKQVGDRLRDAGLLALAMLLGYLLLRRLFGDLQQVELDIEPVAVNPDSIGFELSDPPTPNSGGGDVVNPLSAIEYFREHLTSEQLREQTLKDTLTEQPNRHDIRLELLKLYHERGASEQFAQYAREMYAIAKGKNKEWHQIIELGLELDPDMAFYVAPDDHGFTLNDEFAVDGIRASSVPAGKSVTGKTATSGTSSAHGTVKPDSSQARAEIDELVERQPHQPTSRKSALKNTETASKPSNNDDDILFEDALGVDIELGDAPAVEATVVSSRSGDAYLDEAALDEVVWNNTDHNGLLESDLTINPVTNGVADEPTADSTFDQIASLQSLNEATELTDAVDQPNTGDAVNTEQHTPPASVDESTASESPIASSPVTHSWKDCEVRLDLAVVYLDLGNNDGALVLLNEVLHSGDASQVRVAEGLLKKLSG